MVCKKSVDAIRVPPSDHQLEIILRDLNEIDEDKLKHNELHIQNWISFQNHFPKGIDPLFIRSLLRGCKHRLEKTKDKLEHYLSARHLYPEIYKNRSPVAKDVVQAMDVVNIAVMPKLTQKGNKVIMCGINRHDPSEFNLKGVVKLYFMITDLILSSDWICAGDILVFDAAHFSVSHMTQFFGPFFKIFTALPKQAYALRLKQMHFVNAPPALVKMMAVIKMVTHPKARNSIYVHESPKHFVDVLGAEYSPSDYGGNLKSFRELAIDWYDVLAENADWFESQEDVKITSIPKKIESALSLQDQLGIEGSFRKLDID